ncbi:carbohydrate ABC transporter permease [Frondihabitans australicus]|uniref:Carbohydrate ABC transporter membrane protein 1 (CUT1 family) n=1 Tax=Frondihabitans australicus TaxID=386892 RepID=A0A495IJH7_9MICO|nr:sugar ABC transporter permease [Frondihabitans australicus]RKR75870.1 carbohydrate ABC transporter membrane protein 1 (CUT1 family) [Frondihabitans australicus]
MSASSTALQHAQKSRAAAQGRSNHRTRRNTLAAVLFLAPTVILIVVLRLLPTITAINQSVHQGVPGSLNPPTFVGGQVFIDLFQSASFWQTVEQTLIFNVIVNPLQIVLSLLLAVLLTRGLPGSGLWRTIIFLPAAVPMAGSAIVWGLALEPNGPVNGALEALGLPGGRFLTSPSDVVGSIILIASWIGVGYWMMFLIAGLNDIPGVYYEASKIDGAGPIRTFFSITIPLLRRPLLFVLVADTVSNFVLFAPVQILTNGGPQGKSNFLMFDIYNQAFNLSNPYTAAAELMVLLVIMIAIVTVQFKLLGSGDDE